MGRLQILLFVILFSLLSKSSFAQVDIFPKSQKICLGDSTKIYVSNNIAPLSTFIWQDSSSTGWNNIVASSVYVGVSTDTLFIMGAGLPHHGKKYRCIIDSSALGIRFDTTELSVLNLKSQLTPPKLSSNQQLCSNGTPESIRVVQMPTGGDSTFSFQWQMRRGTAPWTNLIGATDTLLSIDTLSSSAEFRVVATSLSGCGQVISDTSSVEFLPVFTNADLLKTVERICYGKRLGDSIISVLISPIQYYSVFNYQWQKSTDLINWVDILNATLSAFNPSTNFTDTMYYRARIVYKAGCGTFFSDTFSVFPGSATLVPPISGTQTLCFDEVPDTLKINPAIPFGSDVSLQWQSSVNGNTWLNIAGQTTQQLILAKGGSTKFYRVKITWLNCGVKYTDSVLVSVHQAFNAGTIKTNQSICYNSTPTLLSFQNLPSGAGESYSYQWQVSSDSLLFTDIPNANGIIFSPSALTSTTFYRLKVTSNLGCGSMLTNVIRIKVYELFVGPSISASDTVCYATDADTIEISVKASGGNGLYAYQWQSSTNTINWTSIVGQTSNHYQPVGLTVTTYYRLITTSVSGCGMDTSNVVQMRVWPKLQKAKISSTQTICYDTSADTLRVVQLAQGANTQFSYQWQNSSDGLQWNAISGQNVLKYGPGRLTSTMYYRIVATSLYGCGSIASDSVIINVREQAVSGEISGSQWVCYDGTPTKFEMTTPPTGAGNSYAYQWQVSNDSLNFLDVFTATQTEFQANKHTADKYYRLKFVSNFGCASVFSNVIKVSVYDIFEGAEIGSHQILCKGDWASPLTSIVKPRGGSLIYEYQWQRSDDSVAWDDMINELNDSLSLGNVYRTYYYRLISTSTLSCGRDTSSVIKITVLPLPDTSAIIGLSEVCRNQQQLFYTLEKKNSELYDYEWKIDEGTILTHANKMSVFITWNNNSGEDTIVIKQTNKLTGCFNYMKLPILVKQNQAPTITEIVRKSNTNILVTKDSTMGINYQWGYIDKSNMLAMDIPNANLRYVMLPHTFDTTKFIYYVHTWFNECITTTYYNFNPLSLGFNTTEKTIIDLYPNPTEGTFVLRGFNNSKQHLKAYDALGREVQLIFSPQNNEVSFTENQSPGLYYIVLYDRETKISKRIVLKR